MNALIRTSLAVTLAASVACTVQQTDVPALTGPSEFATSISLAATPDTIRQDGVDSSSIVVTARDVNGSPIAGLQLRLDILAGGLDTSPSSNNEVTINRYRVVYRRADGRNTPGVDVPYGFDGGVTGTVGAGASLGLGFELVRHIAKEESPLVQLANSRTTISTIADITFYGRDQVGNDISVTGSITVDFGDFGG